MGKRIKQYALVTAGILKRGLHLVEVAHPEYGEWFVVRPYGGSWELGRCTRPSDVKCVDEAELLQFWGVAS